MGGATLAGRAKRSGIRAGVPCATAASSAATPRDHLAPALALRWREQTAWSGTTNCPRDR